MNTVNICGKIRRINYREKIAFVTVGVKSSRDIIEWVPVSVFQVDFLKKYFYPGKWIGIQGHIHINHRGDNYITEIIADELFFVGNKDTMDTAWESIDEA